VNLEKLTPPESGKYQFRHSQMSPDDWKFYCVARNAFDVMIRRGWSVVRRGEYWFVPEAHVGDQMFADPFTALVVCDRAVAAGSEAPPAKE